MNITTDESDAVSSKGQTEAIFSRAFVLIAVVNMIFTIGFQGLTSAMPLFLAELGGSGVAIGLSTTICTASALVARIFAGPFLDRGARKGVLVASMAVTLFAVCMYPVFPVVGIVLAFRAVNGLGMGLGTTATATIAANLIPKSRFAEGLGFFALSSSIAGAIGPALFVELIRGPGALMMITAAAGCSLSALVLSLFHKDVTTLGEKQNARDVAFSRIGETKQTKGADRFFERGALVPSIAMMLVNVGFASIITFVAVYAQNQGIEGASAYFVVYALTNMASRPFIGRIIDKCGFRVPGSAACICMAATLALIGASDSLWMLCAAGILAGLGQGTCMGSFQTMAVSTADASRRGVATSTFLSFFDLGIAFGSIISGVLAELFGCSMMYGAMALFPLIASSLFLFPKTKG